MRITKLALHAIRSTADTHSVRVWRNNGSKVTTSPSSDSPLASTDHKIVTIASWNCRGIHNSKPYILDMIQNGVDIIILQEHWLFPYELSSLSSIHPQYEFTAISDKRLHSGSDLERGCGGVAILWNKALTCIPTSALDSDRVCGVYMSIPSAKSHLRRCLTILGVYMPSADKSQEIYSSYFEKITRDIYTHPILKLSNMLYLSSLMMVHCLFWVTSMHTSAINNKSPNRHVIIEDDSGSVLLTLIHCITFC